MRIWLGRVGRGDDKRVRALGDRRLDRRDLARRSGGGAACLRAGLAKGVKRGDGTARVGAVGGGEVGVAEVLRYDEDLEARLEAAGA